jgi:hypothetical protein
LKRRLAWILTGALGVVSGRAFAHAGHGENHSARYLKLDASEQDTRLVVSLALSERDGRELFVRGDLDGNSRLDPPEVAALLVQVESTLVPKVSVDGSNVTPAWRERTMAPAGGAYEFPAAIEFVGHLSLRQREHRIELRDAEPLYALTDVALRAHDGAEVDDGARDFVVEGPLDLRCQLSFPARSSRRRRVLEWLAAMVVWIACAWRLARRPRSN